MRTLWEWMRVPMVVGRVAAVIVRIVVRADAREAAAVVVMIVAPVHASTAVHTKVAV